MKTVSLIVLSFLVVAGCGQGKKAPVDQRLNVSGFEEKLGRTEDKILLDVRTYEEYREGHFPEAVLIDIHSKDFADQLNKLDKSKPVFVYCGSGIRSEKAVSIMDGLGFREVYELEGGFKEWKKAGKPFVKE